MWVVLAPEFPQQASDRGHGKGCRVLGHTYPHPAEVSAEIVHAEGDGRAVHGIQKAVDLDLLRLSLRESRPPCVLEPPHQFLLLRVNRNRRLAPLQLALDPFVVCSN